MPEVTPAGVVIRRWCTPKITPEKTPDPKRFLKSLRGASKWWRNRGETETGVDIVKRQNWRLESSEKQPGVS